MQRNYKIVKTKILHVTANGSLMKVESVAECSPWRLSVCVVFPKPMLVTFLIIGPRRDKTCLWGFRQSETQTTLLNYRLAVTIGISPVAKLDMILSNKRKTKR